MKGDGVFIVGHKLGCECLNCEHIRLVIETSDHDGGSCSCDRCARLRELINYQRPQPLTPKK